VSIINAMALVVRFGFCICTEEEYWKRKRKERETATERQYCLGGDACVRWVRGNFFFYGPGPLKCSE
jgi:hypothetical protein